MDQLLEARMKSLVLEANAERLGSTADARNRVMARIRAQKLASPARAESAWRRWLGFLVAQPGWALAGALVAPSISALISFSGLSLNQDAERPTEPARAIQDELSEGMEGHQGGRISRAVQSIPSPTSATERAQASPERTEGARDGARAESPALPGNAQSGALLGALPEEGRPRSQAKGSSGSKRSMAGKPADPSLETPSDLEFSPAGVLSWKTEGEVDRFEVRIAEEGQTELRIEASDRSSRSMRLSDLRAPARIVVRAYRGEEFSDSKALQVVSEAPKPDAFAQAVLAQKPAGFWRLNEGSGTVAYDSSGNGRDGTYSRGGVSYQVPGAAADLAVRLDGDSGTVWFGNFGLARSIEIWAKWGTYAGYSMMDLFSAYEPTGMIYSAFKVGQGGTLMAEAVGPAYWNQTHWADRSKFHQIVLVEDHAPGEVLLYLDGVLIPQRGQLVNKIIYNNLRIGETNDYRSVRWNGDFDEVAIFEKPLTAANVLEHLKAKLESR